MGYADIETVEYVKTVESVPMNKLGYDVCGLLLELTSTTSQHYVDPMRVAEKYGWENSGEIMIGDRAVYFGQYVADGTLGGSVGIFHPPTEAEPYLQFLLSSGRMLVSGWNETEMHYCPCTHLYSFFVSERFPIDKLKNVYGVE